MTRKRCFSIIGGTLWGNRGAEAMICTVTGMLGREWPNTSFHLFSYFSDNDRALVNRPDVAVHDSGPLALATRMLPGSIACFLARGCGLTLPDRFLPSQIVALRQSTALLDVSGISFADGREKFLPFNILCVLPALLLNVPVIKLSQALGPFNRLPTRVLARWVLSRCRKVFARGATSACHLASLELPPMVRSEASDIAFLFETDFSLTDEGTAVAERFGAPQSEFGTDTCHTIGVCPSSVVLSKAHRADVDYLGVLSDLIVTLIRRGDRVVVLPNATRAASNSMRNNDIPVIVELQERCRPTLAADEMARIRWITSDINTAALRRVIAKTDLLVTSRFHAMIGALSMEIPTVVLGWSHKYKEILREFGLIDSFFQFDAKCSGQILDATDKLLSPDFRAHWPAREYIASAQQSAMEQFRYLFREFACPPDIRLNLKERNSR